MQDFAEECDTYIDALNEWLSSWGLPFPILPRMSTVVRGLLGDYPEASEDKLGELMDFWVGETERIADFGSNVSAMAKHADALWSGPGGPQQLSLMMTQFALAVQQQAQTASSLAQGASQFQMQVILAKTAYQANLMLMAFEIVRALAMAVPSWGISLGLIPVSIAAVRVLIAQIIPRALTAITSISFRQILRHLSVSTAVRGAGHGLAAIPLIAGRGLTAAGRGLRAVPTMAGRGLTNAGRGLRNAPTRIGQSMTPSRIAARQQTGHVVNNMVRQAQNQARRQGLDRAATAATVRHLRSRAVRNEVTQQLATGLGSRTAARAASRVPTTTQGLVRNAVQQHIGRGITRGGMARGLASRLSGGHIAAHTTQAMTARSVLTQRVVGYGLHSALKFGVASDLYSQGMTMAATDGRYHYNPTSTVAAFTGAALGGAPLGLASKLPGYMATGAVGGVLGLAGSTAVTNPTALGELTEAGLGKIGIGDGADYEQLGGESNPHAARAARADGSDGITQEDLADAVWGGAFGGAWEKHIGEASFGEAGLNFNTMRTVWGDSALNMNGMPSPAQFIGDPSGASSTATPDAFAGAPAGGTPAGGAPGTGAPAGSGSHTAGSGAGAGNSPQVSAPRPGGGAGSGGGPDGTPVRGGAGADGSQGGGGATGSGSGAGGGSGSDGNGAGSGTGGEGDGNSESGGESGSGNGESRPPTGESGQASGGSGSPTAPEAGTSNGDGSNGSGGSAEPGGQSSDEQSPSTPTGEGSGSNGQQNTGDPGTQPDQGRPPAQGVNAPDPGQSEGAQPGESGGNTGTGESGQPGESGGTTGSGESARPGEAEGNTGGDGTSQPGGGTTGTGAGAHPGESGGNTGSGESARPGESEGNTGSGENSQHPGAGDTGTGEGSRTGESDGGTRTDGTSGEGTAESGAAETGSQGSTETSNAGDGSAETGRATGETTHAPGSDGIRQVGDTVASQHHELAPDDPLTDSMEWHDGAKSGPATTLAELMRQGSATVDPDTGIFTVTSEDGRVVQFRLVLDDTLDAGHYVVGTGTTELTAAGYAQTSPAEIRISTRVPASYEAAAGYGEAQTTRALQLLVGSSLVVAPGSIDHTSGRAAPRDAPTRTGDIWRAMPRGITVFPAAQAAGTGQQSEDLLVDEIARRQSGSQLPPSNAPDRAHAAALAGDPADGTLLVHYREAGTAVAAGIAVDPNLPAGQVQVSYPGWEHAEDGTLRQTDDAAILIGPADSAEQMQAAVDAGLRALHDGVPGRSDRPHHSFNLQAVDRAMHAEPVDGFIEINQETSDQGEAIVERADEQLRNMASPGFRALAAGQAVAQPGSGLLLADGSPAPASPVANRLPTDVELGRGSVRVRFENSTVDAVVLVQSEMPAGTYRFHPPKLIVRDGRVVQSGPAVLEISGQASDSEAQQRVVTTMLLRQGFGEMHDWADGLGDITDGSVQVATDPTMRPFVSAAALTVDGALVLPDPAAPGPSHTGTRSYSVRLPNAETFAPDARAVFDALAERGYRLQSVENGWRTGDPGLVTTWLDLATGETTVLRMETPDAAAARRQAAELDRRRGELTGAELLRRHWLTTQRQEILAAALEPSDVDSLHALAQDGSTQSGEQSANDPGTSRTDPLGGAAQGDSSEPPPAAPKPPASSGDGPSGVALAHSAPVDRELPHMAEAVAFLAQHGVGDQLTPAELNHQLLAAFPDLFTANGRTLAVDGVVFSVGITFEGATQVDSPFELGKRQSTLMGLPELGNAGSSSREWIFSGKVPLSLATGETIDADPQGRWSTKNAHGASIAQQGQVGSSDQHRGLAIRYDLDKVTVWVRVESGQVAELTASGDAARPLPVLVNAQHQEPLGSTVVYDGATRDAAELARLGRLMGLDDTGEVVNAVLAQLPEHTRDDAVVRTQVLYQVQRQERTGMALHPDGFSFEIRDAKGKPHQVTLRTRVDWDAAQPTHAAAENLGHGRIGMGYRTAGDSHTLTRSYQGGSLLGQKAIAAFRFARGRSTSAGTNTSTGHWMAQENFDFRPKHTYRVAVTTEVQVGRVGRATTSQVDGGAYVQLSVQDAARNGLPVGRDDLQYDENGEIRTRTVLEPVLDVNGDARTTEDGDLILVSRQEPLVHNGLAPPEHPHQPNPGQLQDSGPTLLDTVNRVTGVAQAREFLQSALSSGRYGDVEKILAEFTADKAQNWLGEAMQDGFRIPVERRGRTGQVELHWVKVEAKWDAARAQELGRIGRTQRVAVMLTSSVIGSSVEFSRSGLREASAMLSQFLWERNFSRSAGDSFSYSQNAGSRLEYRGPSSLWRVPLTLTVSVVDSNDVPVDSARKEVDSQFLEIFTPADVRPDGQRNPGPTVETRDERSRAQFAELLTSMPSLLHLDSRGLAAAVRSRMPKTASVVDTSNATALAHAYEWLSDGQLIRTHDPHGSVRGRALIKAEPTGLRVLNRLEKVAAGPMGLGQPGHDFRAGSTDGTAGAGADPGAVLSLDSLAGGSGSRTTGVTAQRGRSGGDDDNAMTPYLDALTFEADVDIAVSAGEAKADRVLPAAVSTETVQGKFQFVLSAQQVVEFYADGMELVVSAVPDEMVAEMLSDWADGKLQLDRRVAARAVQRRADQLAATGARIDRRLVDHALAQYPGVQPMDGATDAEAFAELERLIRDTDEEWLLGNQFQLPKYVRSPGQPVAGGGVGTGLVGGWRPTDGRPLQHALGLLSELGQDVAESHGVEEKLRSVLAPGPALNNTQRQAMADGGIDLFAGLVRKDGQWMQLSMTYEMVPTGEAKAVATEPGSASAVGYRHRANAKLTQTSTTTGGVSGELSDTQQSAIGELGEAANVGGTGTRNSSLTVSHAEVNEPGMLEPTGFARFEQSYEGRFTVRLQPAPTGLVGSMRSAAAGQPRLLTRSSTGTLVLKYQMHRAAPVPHGPRPVADYRRLAGLPAEMESRIIEWSLGDLLPSAESAVRDVLRTGLSKPLGSRKARGVARGLQQMFTPGHGKSLWPDLSDGRPRLVDEFAVSPQQSVAVGVQLRNFDLTVVHRYGPGEYGPYGLKRAQRNIVTGHGRSRNLAFGFVGTLPSSETDLGQDELTSGWGMPGVKRSGTDGTSATSQVGSWTQMDTEGFEPHVLVRLRGRFAVTAGLQTLGENGLPVELVRQAEVTSEPIDVLVDVPEHLLPELRHSLMEQQSWALIQDDQLPQGKIKGVLRKLGMRQRAAEENPVDLDSAVLEALQLPGHDPQEPHQAMAAMLRERHPDLTAPGQMLRAISDETAALVAHHRQLADQLNGFLDEIEANVQHPAVLDGVQRLRDAITELDQAAAAVPLAREALGRDASPDELAELRAEFDDAMQRWQAAIHVVRSMIASGHGDENDGIPEQRERMARFSSPAVASGYRLMDEVLAATSALTDRPWRMPTGANVMPYGMGLDPVDLARGLAAELSFDEQAAVEVHLEVVGADGTTSHFRVTGDGRAVQESGPPYPGLPASGQPADTRSAEPQSADQASSPDRQYAEEAAENGAEQSGSGAGQSAEARPGTAESAENEAEQSAETGSGGAESAQQAAPLPAAPAQLPGTEPAGEVIVPGQEEQLRAGAHRPVAAAEAAPADAVLETVRTFLTWRPEAAISQQAPDTWELRWPNGDSVRLQVRPGDAETGTLRIPNLHVTNGRWEPAGPITVELPRMPQDAVQRGLLTGMVLRQVLETLPEKLATRTQAAREAQQATNPQAAQQGGEQEAGQRAQQGIQQANAPETSTSTGGDTGSDGSDGQDGDDGTEGGQPPTAPGGGSGGSGGGRPPRTPAAPGEPENFGDSESSGDSPTSGDPGSGASGAPDSSGEAKPGAQRNGSGRSRPALKADATMGADGVLAWKSNAPATSGGRPGFGHPPFAHTDAHGEHQQPAGPKTPETPVSTETGRNPEVQLDSAEAAPAAGSTAETREAADGGRASTGTARSQAEQAPAPPNPDGHSQIGRLPGRRPVLPGFVVNVADENLSYGFKKGPSARPANTGSSESNATPEGTATNGAADDSARRTRPVDDPDGLFVPAIAAVVRGLQVVPDPLAADGAPLIWLNDGVFINDLEKAAAALNGQGLRLQFVENGWRSGAPGVVTTWFDPVTGRTTVLRFATTAVVADRHAFAEGRRAVMVAAEPPGVDALLLDGVAIAETGADAPTRVGEVWQALPVVHTVDGVPAEAAGTLKQAEDVLGEALKDGIAEKPARGAAQDGGDLVKKVGPDDVEVAFVRFPAARATVVVEVAVDSQLAPNEVAVEEFPTWEHKPGDILNQDSRKPVVIKVGPAVGKENMGRLLAEAVREVEDNGIPGRNRDAVGEAFQKRDQSGPAQGPARVDVGQHPELRPFAASVARHVANGTVVADPFAAPDVASYSVRLPSVESLDFTTDVRTVVQSLQNKGLQLRGVENAWRHDDPGLVTTWFNPDTGDTVVLRFETPQAVAARQFAAELDAQSETGPDRATQRTEVLRGARQPAGADKLVERLEALVDRPSPQPETGQDSDAGPSPESSAQSAQRDPGPENPGDTDTDDTDGGDGGDPLPPTPLGPQSPSDASGRAEPESDQETTSTAAPVENQASVQPSQGEEQGTNEAANPVLPDGNLAMFVDEVVLSYSEPRALPTGDPEVLRRAREAEPQEGDLGLGLESTYEENAAGVERGIGKQLQWLVDADRAVEIGHFPSDERPGVEPGPDSFSARHFFRTATVDVLYTVNPDLPPGKVRVVPPKVVMRAGRVVQDNFLVIELPARTAQSPGMQDALTRQQMEVAAGIAERMTRGWGDVADGAVMLARDPAMLPFVAAVGDAKVLNDPLAEQGDSVYSVVLPDDAFAADAERILAELEDRGFQLEPVVNGWRGGEPGLVTTWRNPDTGETTTLRLETSDAHAARRSVAEADARLAARPETTPEQFREEAARRRATLDAVAEPAGLDALVNPAPAHAAKPDGVRESVVPVSGPEAEGFVDLDGVWHQPGAQPPRPGGWHGTVEFIRGSATPGLPPKGPARPGPADAQVGGDAALAPARRALPTKEGDVWRPLPRTTRLFQSEHVDRGHSQQVVNEEVRLRQSRMAPNGRRDGASGVWSLRSPKTRLVAEVQVVHNADLRNGEVRVQHPDWVREHGGAMHRWIRPNAVLRPADRILIEVGRAGTPEQAREMIDAGERMAVNLFPGQDEAFVGQAFTMRDQGAVADEADRSAIARDPAMRPVVESVAKVYGARVVIDPFTSPGNAVYSVVLSGDDDVFVSDALHLFEQLTAVGRLELVNVENRWRDDLVVTTTWRNPGMSQPTTLHLVTEDAHAARHLRARVEALLADDPGTDADQRRVEEARLREVLDAVVEPPGLNDLEAAPTAPAQPETGQEQTRPEPDVPAASDESAVDGLSGADDPLVEANPEIRPYAEVIAGRGARLLEDPQANPDETAYLVELPSFDTFDTDVASIRRELEDAHRLRLVFIEDGWRTGNPGLVMIWFDPTTDTDAKVVLRFAARQGAAEPGAQQLPTPRKPESVDAMLVYSKAVAMTGPDGVARLGEAWRPLPRVVTATGVSGQAAGSPQDAGALLDDQLTRWLAVEPEPGRTEDVADAMARVGERDQNMFLVRFAADRATAVVQITVDEGLDPNRGEVRFGKWVRARGDVWTQAPSELTEIKVGPAANAEDMGQLLDTVLRAARDGLPERNTHFVGQAVVIESLEKAPTGRERQLEELGLSDVWEPINPNRSFHVPTVAVTDATALPDPRQPSGDRFSVLLPDAENFTSGVRAVFEEFRTGPSFRIANVENGWRKPVPDPGVELTVVDEVTGDEMVFRLETPDAVAARHAVAGLDEELQTFPDRTDKAEHRTQLLRAAREPSGTDELVAELRRTLGDPGSNDEDGGDPLPSTPPGPKSPSGAQTGPETGSEQESTFTTSAGRDSATSSQEQRPGDGRTGRNAPTAGAGPPGNQAPGAPGLRGGPIGRGNQLRPESDGFVDLDGVWHPDGPQPPRRAHLHGELEFIRGAENPGQAPNGPAQPDPTGAHDALDAAEPDRGTLPTKEGDVWRPLPRAVTAFDAGEVTGEQSQRLLDEELARRQPADARPGMLALQSPQAGLVAEAEVVHRPELGPGRVRVQHPDWVREQGGVVRRWLQGPNKLLQPQGRVVIEVGQADTAPQMLAMLDAGERVAVNLIPGQDEAFVGQAFTMQNKHVVERLTVPEHVIKVAADFNGNQTTVKDPAAVDRNIAANLNRSDVELGPVANPGTRLATRAVRHFFPTATVDVLYEVKSFVKPGEVHVISPNFVVRGGRSVQDGFYLVRVSSERVVLSNGRELTRELLENAEDVLREMTRGAGDVTDGALFMAHDTVGNGMVAHDPATRPFVEAAKTVGARLVVDPRAESSESLDAVLAGEAVYSVLLPGTYGFAGDAQMVRAALEGKGLQLQGMVNGWRRGDPGLVMIWFDPATNKTTQLRLETEDGVAARRHAAEIDARSAADPGMALDLRHRMATQQQEILDAVVEPAGLDEVVNPGRTAQISSAQADSSATSSEESTYSADSTAADNTEDGARSAVSAELNDRVRAQREAQQQSGDHRAELRAFAASRAVIQTPALDDRGHLVTSSDGDQQRATATYEQDSVDGSTKDLKNTHMAAQPNGVSTEYTREGVDGNQRTVGVAPLALAQQKLFATWRVDQGRLVPHDETGNSAVDRMVDAEAKQVEALTRKIFQGLSGKKPQQINKAITEAIFEVAREQGSLDAKGKTPKLTQGDTQLAARGALGKLLREDRPGGVEAALRSVTGDVHLTIDGPAHRADDHPAEVCPSCQLVLDNFAELFPNLNVEVRDVQGRPVWRKSEREVPEAATRPALPRTEAAPEASAEAPAEQSTEEDLVPDQDEEQTNPLPRRTDDPTDPHPELTKKEKAALNRRLSGLEKKYRDDFNNWKFDPDKLGHVTPSTMDEARVALDLRELGHLPPDVQRPLEAGQGDYYSPSQNKYWDLKGVHSDWPPLSSPKDKSNPFRGYDPNDNEKLLANMQRQIDLGRHVILDIRNANQVAISDLQRIVREKGWGDDVIWYP